MPLSTQDYFEIQKVRMWEKGHSFDEIEAMSVAQIGMVLAYWRESYQIEKDNAAERRRMGGK